MFFYSRAKKSIKKIILDLFFVPGVGFSHYPDYTMILQHIRNIVLSISNNFSTNFRRILNGFGRERRIFESSRHCGRCRIRSQDLCPQKSVALPMGHHISEKVKNLLVFFFLLLTAGNSRVEHCLLLRARCR